MRLPTRLVLATVVLGAGVGAAMWVDVATASATSPAVLYVATTGADGSNNCLVQDDPCATISHAVSVAASSNTIEVGAGTYDDTVVVNIADLTITGQGSSTVVNPSGASQPIFTLNSDGDSLSNMLITDPNEFGKAYRDGIDVSGNLATINNDNVTGFGSEGIANSGNNVTISDDLVQGNDGGIYNQGDTVTMANDTIIFNHSSQTWGGAGVWSSGTGVILTDDTIALNELDDHGYGAAGGIRSAGPPGSLTIGATIVSQNTTFASNCYGQMTDAGYNLEWTGSTAPGSDSCGFSSADNDITGQDPNLQIGAGWNGGPTQTVAIGAGSAAQGAIPASSPFCTGSDQRGTPRLQPGSTACDMGAFQSIGGYWEVASDGGIFAFGAPFFGSTGGTHLNAPIVGMAEDPLTGGYWEVASDGGVFAFNAPFYGSMGGQHLNAPIVGMAADLKDGGYWLVASDGGIFSFGGARYLGSMGGQPLNAPIVDMAFDPNSGGYWEVASDGGIFNFGHAAFYGSMGGQHLNAPVAGIADGAAGGYWEVASDGGIFNFGAPFFGSMGGTHLNAPMVGLASPPNRQGYWEVASDGGIFSFGVPFQGSMGGAHLNAPIVGIATG